MQRRLLALALGALATTPAVAAMSCADLGAYLAVQPNVVQVNATTPLTTLTSTGTSPRCEANFVYSARGGTAAGYAEGQAQRIVLRVGLPRNSIDGGSGGVKAPGTARCRTSAAAAWSATWAASTAATNAGLRRLLDRFGPYLGRESQLRRSAGHAHAELRQARRLPDREPAAAVPVGAESSPRPITAWRTRATTGTAAPPAGARAFRWRSTTARTSMASWSAPRPTSTRACR